MCFCIQDRTILSNCNAFFLNFDFFKKSMLAPHLPHGEYLDIRKDEVIMKLRKLKNRIEQF